MVAAQRPIENDSLTKQQEKAARLIAAGELTRQAIADRVKVGVATIYRWQDEPAFRARVLQLREAFRDTAMEDEPFADKRLRVVSRGAVARDTLATLQANDYEEPYYYGPDALEARRFDAGRVQAFRQYLNDIAEEMGDRGAGRGQSISVNVGVAVSLSTEERVARLAGLFARLGAADD